MLVMDGFWESPSPWRTSWSPATQNGQGEELAVLEEVYKLLLHPKSHDYTFTAMEAPIPRKTNVPFGHCSQIDDTYVKYNDVYNLRRQREWSNALLSKFEGLQESGSLTVVNSSPKEPTQVRQRGSLLGRKLAKAMLLSPKPEWCQGF